MGLVLIVKSYVGKWDIYSDKCYGFVGSSWNGWNRVD